ncbi:MAG: single-stranded DNA-binding protein [Nitrosomonas sp.]|nr:single-stranded DNA-binding protein [Nitrosomonas sp.]
MSITTTDKGKERNNSEVMKIEWHRVRFFRKLAKIENEYLKKIIIQRSGWCVN